MNEKRRQTESKIFTTTTEKRKVLRKHKNMNDIFFFIKAPSNELFDDIFSIELMSFVMRLARDNKN